MHFRPQSWRAIALASLLFLPALPVLAGTPVLKAVGKNGNPTRALNSSTYTTTAVYITSWKKGRFNTATRKVAWLASVSSRLTS